MLWSSVKGTAIPGRHGKVKSLLSFSKEVFFLFYFNWRPFSATLARIWVDIEVSKFLPDGSWFAIMCGRVRVNHSGVQFNSWGFQFLLPSLEAISWCSNSVSCQVAESSEESPGSSLWWSFKFFGSYPNTHELHLCSHIRKANSDLLIMFYLVLKL